MKDWIYKVLAGVAALGFIQWTIKTLSNDKRLENVLRVNQEGIKIDRKVEEKTKDSSFNDLVRMHSNELSNRKG